MKHLKSDVKDLIIEVTKKGYVETTTLKKKLGEKSFVIIFQPGAGQPAASKNLDNWIQKGLSGCTNEASDYGNLLDSFDDIGVNVFIVNTMNSAEQQKAIIDKGFNPNLMFISDPELKLGDVLGVNFVQVNGAVVHEPTIGIYTKNGNCLHTEYPEKKCSAQARRKTAEQILQTCKNILNPQHEKEIQQLDEEKCTMSFNH